MCFGCYYLLLEEGRGKSVCEDVCSLTFACIGVPQDQCCDGTEDGRRAEE